eukprot:SAG31_NODE_1831_length_7148_cov_8.788055_1_plen_982_part_10
MSAFLRSASCRRLEEVITRCFSISNSLRNNPCAQVLLNAWRQEAADCADGDARHLDQDSDGNLYLDKDSLRRVMDAIFDNPKMTIDQFHSAISSIGTIKKNRSLYQYEDAKSWLVSRPEAKQQTSVKTLARGMWLLRMANKAKRHREAARAGYTAGLSLGWRETDLLVLENVFFNSRINPDGYGYLMPDQMLSLMTESKIKRLPMLWQLDRVFRDTAFKQKEAVVKAGDSETAEGESGDDAKTITSITYETFVRHLHEEAQDSEKGIQREETLVELFRVMDYDSLADGQSNSDGELSRKELKFFLTLSMRDSLKNTVSDDDAALMLRYADVVVSHAMSTNDDGKLMADEFVMLMKMYNDGEPTYRPNYNDHGLSDTDFVKANELWLRLRAVLHVLLYFNSLFDKCSHYSEEYLEQWTAEVDARCCFFNPDAPKRQAWDLAMLPLFLVIIIMVPLRIGFDFDEPPGTFLWWFDAMTDVYFLIDIVINFRTAYHDDHGQLEVDLKKIRSAYLKSWFLIDFLSCLPIPYVMLIIQEIKSSEETGGGTQFKLAKILRLVRLAKNLARLGRLSKLKELVAQWEDHLEPIMTGLQLLKLLFILLLLGHLMACTWYYVGVSSEVREDNYLVNGWVYEERWGNRVGRWTRYVASYVYSLTDFTYEVSNTNDEKITAVVLHLIYETFFGYLVGTFATIVMAGKVADQVKGEKLQAVRDVTKHAKLPPTVRKQFRSYYDVMFKYKSVFDEEAIIDELPESIRRVLVDHKIKLFKQDYQFFAHDFTSDVILKISLKMRRLHVLQGSYIVCEGDEARDVYFLIQGQAVVEKKTRTGNTATIGAISPGMMFGEVELVAMVVGRDCRRIRQRSVKARTTLDVGFVKYSEMWNPNRDGPDGLMQEFDMLKHRVITSSNRRQEAERRKALIEQGIEDVPELHYIKNVEDSNEVEEPTIEERMTKLERQLAGFKDDVLQRFDQLFSSQGIAIVHSATI